MRPLNTEGYPYWLDAAVRGGLGPPPKVDLSNRFTSMLQTLGILSPPTSKTMSALSTVHSKRIMIMGIDGSGKKTLLRKHTSRDAIESANRDIQRRNLLEEIRFHKISIDCIADPRTENAFYSMEVGGCEPYRIKYTERALCLQVDAIVWVMDSADRDRIVEVTEEIKQNLALHHCSSGHGKGGDEALRRILADTARNTPVAILLNKRDHTDAMTVSAIEGFLKPATDQLANRKWKLFETTVTTGRGVSEAMKWVALQLQDDDSSLAVSEKQKGVESNTQMVDEKRLGST